MSNTRNQLMLATRLPREDAAVLQAHADAIGTNTSALVRKVLLSVVAKLKAQQAQQGPTTTEGQPDA